MAEQSTEQSIEYRTAQGYRREPQTLRLAAFCCAVLLCQFSVGSAADRFSNSTPININNDAPASPYPSEILVSNLLGEIAHVTLTISNLTHEYPMDLELLVVDPRERTCLVMAHVGGIYSVTNVTIEFDDAAPDFVAQQLNMIVSGAFRPTVSERPGSNYLLVPPAPAPPYDYDLAMFSGGEPNGTWKLFVVDSDDESSGVIANGWALAIETAVRLRVRPESNQVEITWPSNVPDSYVLESSMQITNGEWTAVPQAVEVTAERRIVRVPVIASNGSRFFRLHKVK